MHVVVLNRILALCLLLLGFTTINQVAEAGETRLKRPTVLYGAAERIDQVQLMNASVDSLFPEAKTPPPPLSGSLVKTGFEQLANRDLVVFVDKSFSMNTRDCPHTAGEIPVNDRSPGFLGKNPGSISRWRWTAGQTMSLSRELAAVKPEGFRLILFNDWRTIYDNVKPADIPAIFMSTKVGGSENTVVFLAEQLNQYMARKSQDPKGTRPLAVVILTDGLPDDRANLPAVLIQAANQMASPEDIKVLFIQVGQSDKGGDFLADLDDNLVSKGARFDIVDHRSFDEVVRSGVGQAVLQAIRE
ncbi:MAG: hypothetical protein KC777_04080 [Cyanobacteria bacterium HKST-UBA02]|nr:hypothetical protein [Cyanobacteria bacterium HKST-UBA02]